LPSVREVAHVHAVNPMTISKAYALLEGQGVLERQRGKPMRVAARRKNQAGLTERLEQLAGPVEDLVLAARQLEIGKKDLVSLVNKKWENGDV
jgi:GntR family transcriptional regulator